MKSVKHTVDWLLCSNRVLCFIVQLIIFTSPDAFGEQLPTFSDPAVNKWVQDYAELIDQMPEAYAAAKRGDATLLNQLMPKLQQIQAESPQMAAVISKASSGEKIALNEFLTKCMSKLTAAVSGQASPGSQQASTSATPPAIKPAAKPSIESGNGTFRDLKEAAKPLTAAITKAYSTGDSRDLFDLSYPKMNEKFGGEDARVAHWNSMIDDARQRGISFELLAETTRDSTSKLNGRKFGLVTFTIARKQPDGAYILSRNYLAAFDSNKWYFLAVDDLIDNPSWVNEWFPDGLGEVKLPPREADKRTGEINQGELQFDGETYALGFKNVTSTQIINEYVRPGDTVEHWDRLITIQQFPQIDDPLRFATAVSNDIRRKVPGETPEVLQKPNEYILWYSIEDKNLGKTEYIVQRICKEPEMAGLKVYTFSIHDSARRTPEAPAEITAKKLGWELELSQWRIALVK